MKISFRKFPYRSLSLKLKEEKGSEKKAWIAGGKYLSLDRRRKTAPPARGKGGEGPAGLVWAQGSCVLGAAGRRRKPCH